jgi:DNA polymerase I
MRRMVCDIETDSLTPSIIWIIGLKDIDSGETWSLERPDLHPGTFNELASEVGTWVGHNFLAFDLPAIRRLVAGSSIDPASVVDTLVVSKLLNYNLEGGHSLEAWGDRFGFPKPKLADFSKLTDEMRTRVMGDVEINFKLYEHYAKYIEDPEWADALETEHQMVLVCLDMQKNGMLFDMDAAKALYEKIKAEVAELSDELQAAFPPRSKLVKVVTPKETKHGTLSLTDFRFLGPDPDLTPYSVGASFSRIVFVPFNPGSPTQVVERLNEAGWKPTEKTVGHIKELRKRGRDRDPARLKHFKEWGWKVSETNLDTLPDTSPPAARKLKDYLTLLSRQRKLEEWFGVYNQATGRIHGVFNSLGAWTHRMAHSAPNMGNNVALTKRYGTEMRGMWRATPGRVLIGTDMDAAHLRLFAHYIDDEEFTAALLDGDPHSLNATALGLDPKKHYEKANDTGRQLAKRFIYSFLNGAAAGKVAQILVCNLDEAQERIDLFEDKYPGFKAMKRHMIPRDAARGFFVGLDGRKVMWDKEHGMMPGYLQNGEVVIMKKANLLWRKRLDEKGIPYWQVNFVHDEWQTETIDDKECIETVKQEQVQAIIDTGEIFKLRCPLSGSSKMGYNWAETH